MIDAEQLSVEDVINALALVLTTRYGAEAVSVAERQAEMTGALPADTWRAIITRLRTAN